MRDIEIPNVQEGDLVELVGLDCLANGTIRRINQTGDGILYIFCEHGQHRVQSREPDPVFGEFFVATRITKL